MLIAKIYSVYDVLFHKSLKANYMNKKIGYHLSMPETPFGSKVFIHVPRTGGTSISKYMEEYKKRFWEDLLYIEPHYIPNFEVPIENYKYYTVLRNPVERALSYYRLQLRDIKQPYRHLACAGEKIFVSNCWEGNNIYVRYFSNSVGKRDLDNGDLRCAFDTLRKFSHVIPFEKIGSFFPEEFPLDDVEFPHLNKTSFVGETGRIVKLLQEKNSLDMKLYKMLMEEII